MESLVFSPDGNYLAIGSNDALVIKVKTGREITRIKKHQGEIKDVAFSPDGEYLATGSYDKTVRLTRIKTGKEIAYINHKDEVNTVAFSPNGKYLATGSKDNIARIHFPYSENLMVEICRRLKRNLRPNEWTTYINLSWNLYDNTCKDYPIHRDFLELAQKLAKEKDLELTITFLREIKKIDSEMDLNLYTKEIETDPETVAKQLVASVIVKEGKPQTFTQQQKALGQKCQSFHLALCTLIGLTLMSIQMDEIWSFLQKKKHQLWLFITLEAQTKFWVNFELGSRTSHTAHRLLRNLVCLMPSGFEHFLLVTTDKLAAYEKAISNCLEKVRHAYLPIVKQRRKRRLVTVKKRIVKGKETDFGHKTQNTSYIERLNLTLRQKVSYLQRKTLGYCKNQKNFEWVLWINLFNYNYRQFHKSLRQDLTGQPQKFKRRYQHLTPAMKIGLATTKL